MPVDGISNSYAQIFAGMRPKSGNSDPAATAEFAAFLPDENFRATAAAPVGIQSDMKLRILQIGLARYTQEQKEVEKVMRILDLVCAECDPEVRAELDKIIEKFKKEPPLNGEDALKKIRDYIEAMPPGDLKLRMLKAFDRIKELMAMSDEALERLEKEAQSRKMTSTSSAFSATANAGP